MLRKLLFVLSLLTCSALVAADELRDPTQPDGYMLAPGGELGLSETEKSGPAPLVLHSIIMGRGRRLAVINDSVLSVGDTVEQSVVREIADNAVKVEQAGRISVLVMDQEQIRFRKR